MKKTLVAIAALAAFGAQAQSSVTMYGNIDMSYASSKNTNTTAAGVASVVKQTNTGNGDGVSTSIIGFRGTEDLGSGLSANFQLEYDLTDAGIGGNGNATGSKTAADAAIDTNASAAGTVTGTNSNNVVTGTSTGSTGGFGARQSWIGLKDSKLGELRLGRQSTSVHGVIAAGLAGGGANIAGSLYSSGMNGFANDSAVRPQTVYMNRAVTYISPSFSGVTVQLQTANQEIDNAGAVSYAKATGGSVSYVNGPLAVAYGLNDIKVDDTSANATNDVVFKQTGLSASYDLKVAKLFVLNTGRKDTKAGALTADTKLTEIGVSAPFGKTTAWASTFTGTRDGLTQSAIATANADVKGYMVGAKYDLSKRTSAYAIMGKQSIEVKASTLKVETSNTAIGIRHAF